MTVQNIINQRKSIRQFREETISLDMINNIVDAGRMSPSGRNGQEWEFIVVQEKELKEKFYEICYNQKCVKECDALIVVNSLVDNIMPNGQNQGTVNCSIASAFMMLQITEFGLGSVLLGHYNSDKVKELLSIQEGMIVSILAVGYPNEEGRVRKRKELSDITKYYL